MSAGGRRPDRNPSEEAMTLEQKLKGIEERIEYIIEHDRPSDEIAALIRIRMNMLSKTADAEMVDAFYEEVDKVYQKHKARQAAAPVKP